MDMYSPQLLLPIGHVEAGSLKLGQVERGVDRARRDGTRGVRVVVGGRHRHDLVFRQEDLSKKSIGN